MTNRGHRNTSAKSAALNGSVPISYVWSPTLRSAVDANAGCLSAGFLRREPFLLLSSVGFYRLDIFSSLGFGLKVTDEVHELSLPFVPCFIEPNIKHFVVQEKLLASFEFDTPRKSKRTEPCGPGALVQSS